MVVCLLYHIQKLFINYFVLDKLFETEPVQYTQNIYLRPLRQPEVKILYALFQSATGNYKMHHKVNNAL